MTKRRKASRRSRARSYFKRRASSKKKIPLAPVIGLLGTVMSAKHPYAGDGDTMVAKLIGGDMKGAMNDLSPAFTGIAGGKMHWGTLAGTWAPVIVGCLIHKYVGGSLGVNRMIKNVPFVNV